ncbi:MAG: hypothetical protein K0Q97_61 [Bacillota bacterium]|jgi:hypothetical protein|nr:hypothetical protein [Bacillota bacterium]
MYLCNFIFKIFIQPSLKLIQLIIDVLNLLYTIPMKYIIYIEISAFFNYINIYTIKNKKTVSKIGNKISKILAYVGVLFIVYFLSTAPMYNKVEN